MLRLPEVPQSAEKLLMAFVRLGSDDDYNEVYELILNGLHALEKVNRSEKDEIVFRWNQGAIQVLEDLIRYTREARTLVEKYRTYKI